MDLTPEYVKAEENVISMCTQYGVAGADPARYNRLRDFCRGHKRVLSIGCAGYEPVVIHATHALDVSLLAYQYLRSVGWRGKFRVGTCTYLPYSDKSMNCGVCSEVIEHLPSMADVVEALLEIDRVCKNWIVTTPAVKVSEPDHKLMLSEDDVGSLARLTEAEYSRSGTWWFLVKVEK